MKTIKIVEHWILAYLHVINQQENSFVQLCANQDVSAMKVSSKMKMEFASNLKNVQKV
jgi:hypothetical protein